MAGGGSRGRGMMREDGEDMVAEGDGMSTASGGTRAGRDPLVGRAAPARRGGRALRWGPVRIGGRRPALVVALTGPSIPAAVEQARRAAAAGAEVLELRVDLLEEVRAALDAQDGAGPAPDGASAPGRGEEASPAAAAAQAPRAAQGPGTADPVGPAGPGDPVGSADSASPQGPRRVERAAWARRAATRVLEALRALQDAGGRAGSAAAAPSADGADAGNGAVPLLLTCRTTAEGGKAPLDDAHYAAVLLAVVEGLAHWPRGRRPAAIDVELGRGALPGIAAAAHDLGMDVVGSFHDFSATPGDGQLEGVLARMASQGADLAKAAVMPRCAEDVARLLGVGARMSGALEIPVAVISMGAMGAVSRVAPVFGSALTFVVVPDEHGGGGASAPGQLPIDQVRRCLDLLQG